MSTSGKIKLVNRVKFYAILDAVLTWTFDMILIGLTVCSVAMLFSFESLKVDGDTLLIIGLVVIGIASFFLILLAVKLYRGAKNNDPQSCQTWYRVTVALLVLHIIGMFVTLTNWGLNCFPTGLYGLHILYKAGEMNLVYRFMEGLTNQGKIVTPTNV
ncbi:unnamed protein product [Orchesella dallaii]|uniref:Uncharacterized protein n=1 Tax=Orchesella dallaii TaxID=48710 RepID=A0ABP1PZK5_9HEXA